MKCSGQFTQFDVNAEVKGDDFTSTHIAAALQVASIDTRVRDFIRPLVLNDIHTCRKLVVREGTRIDVSVK